MKQKNTHGGKRQNAGRKSIDNPKMVLSARVSPDLITKAKNIAKKEGITVSEFVENCLQKI